MSAARNIVEVLQEMVAPMPAGAAVVLPVDWLRSTLDTAFNQPAPAVRHGQSSSDLSVIEVAKMVGRKPSTVRGWCAAGQLDGYRLNGRDWRVTHAALQAFLQGQRKGTEPATRTERRRATLALGAWRSVRTN